MPIGPFKGLSLGLWGTITAMRATSGTTRALALRHTLLGRVILRTKGLIRGFGRALVGLGPRIAGLAVSLKTFSGAAGLVMTAIRGISMAISGIPLVGWILALITALVLLYMKSEGFRKWVNSLVKWVLALVIYAFEVAKSKWIEFMDWLSGKVPDWVKELGGWFGDLFGWFDDDRYAGAGASVEESTKGLQEKTERLRLLRRIESGEETWSLLDDPLSMLHDPVTPPPILPPGAGVAAVQAQAAADSFYSKSMLYQSRSQNVTVNNSPVITVNAKTDANADEIARATTSAWQEAGRNMAEDNDSARSE